MDELSLLAAICKSRKAYDKLERMGLDSQNFSEVASAVLNATRDQYKRDPDIEHASRDLVETALQRRYGKGSLADSAMALFDRFPRDVSKVNVVEEYRLLRLQRVSTALASKLASGDHGESTEELLDQYKSLSAGEEAESFKERLTEEDFAEDDSDRIMLYPKSLSTYIGKGVRRGHNVTVYGRPNSAKSMFALSNAAILIKHGYRVLYIANEEPAQDITLRLLARLTRMPLDELQSCSQARSEAFRRAEPEYRNWILLHKGEITARDIRRQAARLNPDVIILDQLKNVHVAEDNRALQLDKLARQVREIGIDYNAVTMSLTQAGESAEQKLKLGMSDVEWSNTGIPGAADLMIGIGVNDAWNAEGKRLLTISKNKIKNEHGSFPVWINPNYTVMSGKAL
jgi:KaiC/GvpD/RAD55 family RecA-like ATPase